MDQSRKSDSFHPAYSLWLADPIQLERTLVGNGEIIRDFLQRLNGIEAGGAPNHILLVGPRGIGKTHLLCLTRHYVRKRLPPPQGWILPAEPWMCPFFTEEEYAGQNSLANFLITLFAKLREEAPDEQLWLLPANVLNETDQRVADCCLERLHRFRSERKKHILLVIDNLQKILQQWPDDEQYRLRGFISRGNVVILGSAPSVFREVIDQKAAFHDFFEICILAELTTPRILELLERRFQEDGRSSEFEARREELSKKVPAIEVLTGGNPRLVVFLYQIATRSSFLEIENALRSLIEELREYFVRRFDELPDQSRKVLDTIAQMSGPSTPKEIAQAARLGLPLVNSQMKRLKEAHYVRPIKLKRQRETRYDISERLFRIWRQTATVAGRQRFRFLADFLKIYFSPDEIRGLYSQHVNFLTTASGRPREEALRHIEELFYFQSAEERELRYGAFSHRVDALRKLGESRWAEDEIKYFASESLKQRDKQGMTLAYKKQADVHTETGRITEAAQDIARLLKEGAYKETIESADKLLRKNRTSSLAWLCLGEAAFRLHEYERALEAFREVADLGKPSSELWWIQAALLNELARYQEALECAEHAIALAPDDAEAWAESGRAAGNLGDYERALAAFRKAAEVGEPTTYLWCMQAKALGDLGRHQEALDCAEHVIALEPNNAMAWTELGRAAGSLRNHERALEAFRRAADVSKPTAELWCLQSEALGYLARFQEALDCAEQAIAIEPNNAAAWLDCGGAAGGLGHYQRALEAFRKAADLSKPTPALWCVQAIVLYYQNRLQEALVCVEEALRIDPQYAPALETGAQCLGELGRISERLSYLERALAVNSSDSKTWLAKARTFEELDRTEEALQAIDEAAKHGAVPKDWRQARGDILLLSGRYVEALRELETALREQADDWNLLSGREITLGCLGHHGPLMEALPGALNRANIPPGSRVVVFQFMLDVALRCAQRGEAEHCIGLFNAALVMTEQHKLDKFGPQLGRFLRQVLDVQPQLFTKLVESITGKTTDENLLKLLDPFLKAAEFIQKKDVVLLEKLFPEVRELVLDIVRRVDPDLHNQIGKGANSA